MLRPRPQTSRAPPTRVLGSWPRQAGRMCLAPGLRRRPTGVGSQRTHCNSASLVALKSRAPQPKMTSMLHDWMQLARCSAARLGCAARKLTAPAGQAGLLSARAGPRRSLRAEAGAGGCSASPEHTASAGSACSAAATCSGAAPLAAAHRTTLVPPGTTSGSARAAQRSPSSWTACRYRRILAYTRYRVASRSVILPRCSPVAASAPLACSLVSPCQG